MALLEYISDENFYAEVELLLKKAKSKRDKAESTFLSNVIDPFCALFEAPAYSTHAEWRNAELTRQCQKTIQNHVGTFHQRILGHVIGWSDMKTGGIIDLVNTERKIIAEVKNKYSTVTGGDLSDKYKSLEELITPKHSKFKGYCAYFVNIIPKHPTRTDIPFTPSDKGKGQPCAINENIRIIDGASFYQIVTNRPNALRELHDVLPIAIEKILNEKIGAKDFTIPDKTCFSKYFDIAYGDSKYQ
ncbi:Eco47II family restriction endonuclease [Salmonella enterica subsp. enterica serovar Virchow]|nr:Eco47II family restriction endonuclease [Salmonella enterica subsp. enterica serovar Virchow]